ncbi:MAG TPA: hypothetical protein VNL94_09975 [Candidatus Binatia bacterium]|nr:hypothetical protein [Candidatus Binatia bacterium]
MLLAGGFGLLGGRPDPSSSPTTGAAAPSSTAPPPSSPPPAPLVTPFAPCGPDPGTTPPTVELQTNGVPTPGFVELIDLDAQPIEPTPTPADPLASLRGPRVEVHPDVVTEISIEGGACALRWFIVLYDPVTGDGDQLDQVPTDGEGDVRLAAQNRFGLWHRLSALRDFPNDVQLIAVFQFEEIAIAAWWRVRVMPLRMPDVRLLDLRDDEVIPLAAGCDLRLRLGNGYEEDLLGCVGDVSAELGAPTRIDPDDPLLLESDGVPAEDLVVVCGRLSGSSFVAEPEPACNAEPPDGQPFPVAAPAGPWVLALSTCVLVDSPSTVASNSLCGTWYAHVRVDD